MPRPQKCRRICGMPPCNDFSPRFKYQDETVVLSLDEYETIRIIDYEAKTQEECSKLMNVSRPTISAIYERARQKVATCLVEAKSLKIDGGDYEICQGGLKECHHVKKCCQRQRKKENMKKIAVTYMNGVVFPHFGKSENFKLYEVADNKVISSKLIDNEGQGHGALVTILQAHGVDTLICGGIGAGAQNGLAEAGIKVYGGVEGNCDIVVENLLKGTLKYNPDVACSHHEHDHHEGGCGSHGCK